MRPFPPHMFKPRDPKFVADDGEEPEADRPTHQGYQSSELRTPQYGRTSEKPDDQERGP